MSRKRGSTSRTVAKEAERQHRRSLEDGFNNFKEVRQNRIRVLEDIIDEYLTGYRLRYRSASFAEYALGHVGRLLGTKIVADITETAVPLVRYRPEAVEQWVETLPTGGNGNRPRSVKAPRSRLAQTA